MNVQNPTAASNQCKLVCIGASAGGLQAAREFLSRFREDTGACVLLTQHLGTTQESREVELLRRETSLNVHWAENGSRLESDAVLLCPPGFTMIVEGSRIRLIPIERSEERTATVDSLFKSASAEHGERVACVVLSGTGKDGAEGARAVSDAGGLVLVQDPEEAGYDGMPRAAIETGSVDVVAPVAMLSEHLMKWSRMFGAPEASEDARQRERLLTRILDVVLDKTGHDFKEYKRSTLWRRIFRRQVVQCTDQLEDYLDVLKRDADEVEALFGDLLISVTSFFRDPEAFEILDRRFLPGVFAGKEDGDSVRVWVAGCATGEEAYSIALLLLRHASRSEAQLSVQVFATDIDEKALEVARAGEFAEHLMDDVPSELKEQYFVEGESGWSASTELRETILFAHHNVLKDPPFSRLDLVCCRNTLIYFSRAVQKDVLRVFHYALNPEGLLFLGRSESAESSQLFAAVHSSARIYRQREGVVGLGRLRFAPVVPQWTGGAPGRTSRRPALRLKETPDHRSFYEDWVLTHRTPPRIVLNPEYHVTHVLSGAARYLNPEGPVSQDAAGLITSELQHPLSLGLRRALSEESEVRTRAVTLQFADGHAAVTMSIIPVYDDGELKMIDIAFSEEAILEPEMRESKGEEREADLRQLVAELEDEVAHLHAELRVSYEEYETSSEELRASNEELQSTNEELQSTAEELETSREELQSMNEELISVNQELKVKIDELMAVNSDLQNLMHATEVSTIFLDRNLRIKRFTPPVAEIFNILPADIGRPISHLSHQLEFDELDARSMEVLENLSRFEAEVRHHDGRWFSLRLWPYRTIDHRIEGVVLTFVDVSAIKKAALALELDAAEHELFAKVTRKSLEGLQLADIIRQSLPEVCRILGCDRVAIWLEDEHVEPLYWSRDLGLIKSLDESWSQASQLLDRLDADNFYSLTSSAPWDPNAESTLLMALPSGPNGESAGFIWAGRTRGVPFDEQSIHFASTLASVLGQVRSRLLANQRRIELLREVESFYNNAPIGLAMLDQELGVKRVNQALMHMFDIEGSDADQGTDAGPHSTEQGPWELPPELASDIVKGREQVVESGAPLVDRVALAPNSIQPSTDRVWLYSLYPLDGPAGTVVGFHLIVRDVTQEYRGRQALEESERRFRTLASLVTDHAYELELQDGVIVPVWSTIAEPLPDRLQYPAIFELFAEGYQPDPEKSAKIAERLEVLRARNHVSTEYSVTASDGQTTWFRDVALAERDGNGDIKRITGAAEDVTMERTTERLVAQAEKYESLRVLAGGVAHDFNNLLVAILGQLGMLSEQPSPEDIEEALELATDAAERASAIAGDLLAYSGEAVGKKENISLARLLGDVTRLFSAMLSGEIALELYIGEPSIHAVVNESQLHQVLLNLLRNASQSMQSGTVNVRLSGYQLLPEETDWWDLTGRAVPPGDYCLIEIEDDGQGMSAEVQQRMFEPFFTTRKEGSGVGMSAALGFIRSQNGGIKVWSAVGHGTTISILLPRVAPAPEDDGSSSETEEAEIEPALEEQVTGQRILIVDDEEVVLRTLTKVLRRQDYNVTPASGATEAIELFDNADVGFDLLIADQSMPEMTGVELAANLRKSDPQLSVIITSGFARGDITGLLEETGAIFLSKPFQLTKLKQVVKEALAK